MTDTKSNQYQIVIDVIARYLEEQSIPDLRRFVFAYTIRVRNGGAVAAKLMSRHWVITDSNGKIEEVFGNGVVGKQPFLNPGEEFVYTSGAILETPVGTMKGTYDMVTNDGIHFTADVPIFTLSIPRTLH